MYRLIGNIEDLPETERQSRLVLNRDLGELVIMNSRLIVENNGGFFIPNRHTILALVLTMFALFLFSQANPPLDPRLFNRNNLLS